MKAEKEELFFSPIINALPLCQLRLESILSGVYIRPFFLRSISSSIS